MESAYVSACRQYLSDVENALHRLMEAVAACVGVTPMKLHLKHDLRPAVAAAAAQKFTGGGGGGGGMPAAGGRGEDGASEASADESDADDGGGGGAAAAAAAATELAARQEAVRSCLGRDEDSEDGGCAGGGGGGGGGPVGAGAGGGPGGDDDDDADEADDAGAGDDAAMEEVSAAGLGEMKELLMSTLGAAWCREDVEAQMLPDSARLKRAEQAQQQLAVILKQPDVRLSDVNMSDPTEVARVSAAFARASGAFVATLLKDCSLNDDVMTKAKKVVDKAAQSVRAGVQKPVAVAEEVVDDLTAHRLEWLGFNTRMKKQQRVMTAYRDHHVYVHCCRLCFSA